MSWGPLLLPGPGRAALGLLALGAVLAAGLCWAALRRPDRRRLGLRLACTLLGLMCLLQLVLRPQLLRPVPPAAAVLLTPGAGPEAARRIASSRTQDLLLFTLDGAGRAGAAFQNVPDAAFLRRRHPEIDRLRVVGHGLDQEDWAELGPLQVELEPAPHTPGFARVLWPRRIELGQELIVQGSLAGEPAQGRLSLHDPGGPADAVEIRPAAGADFELRAVPRSTGRFLYRLELADAQGRPLVQEALDVAVAEPEPLAVLWLEGAPRFETKFFKAWLAGSGGSMAIRSAVSRERFRFESLNRPARAEAPQAPALRLDAALLEEFDLAVADVRTLRALGPEEREALRSAVARAGLGLLVLADEALPAAAELVPPELAFFLDFERAAVGDLERRKVSLSWPGLERHRPGPLPVGALEIRPGFAAEALVTDLQGRVLVARRQRGRGAVALSLVQESYRWVLEGQAPLHAAYWSFLTSELARPERGAERWSVPDGPVLVDRPLPLLLATPRDRPAGAVEAPDGREERIALRQDAREPARWSGTYWPRETGWHRVGSEKAGGVWFYAQEPSAWRTWQEVRRADASRNAEAGSGAGRAESQPARRPQPIPQLLFYLGFLLCMAVLWIEEKT
jgi:hypothetical protein